MATNKRININFNNGNLIDDVGAVLMTVPNITYKSDPTWELHFVDVSENGTMIPVDLTEATAWHAAIDNDFNASTDPMVRTLADGIDASQAVSGIIAVELNTATSSYFQKINNREQIPAFFELRGLDAEDKVVYDFHFRVYARGAIDPEGGDPLPIESGGVTLNDVYAVVNGVVNDLQPLITEDAKLGYDLVSGAPAIPTSTSQLTNDSGFITTTSLSSKQDLITAEAKLDYSLLSGTPTIPTVNNATLTITQGGVTKGTWSANSSSGVTIALDAGGGGGGGSYDDQINYLSSVISGQNERIEQLEAMLSGFAQELMTFTISGDTTERVFLTSGVVQE